MSSLLRPEVTVWLNTARTHSVNFDKAVRLGKFPSVDEAIAHEFGYFVEYTSGLVIVNADEPLILAQMQRATSPVREIKDMQTTRYDIGVSGTGFLINGVKYHVPFLLPQETTYAIVASVQVAEYFGKQPTNNLLRLAMPPGRSSLFKGIKDTTIVDSSYNVNVASVAAIFRMVERLPGNKWLILGDLTEQGAQEKEEHEKIARMLLQSDFKKIILIGPRLALHALPILKERAISFEKPREALDYILASLQGGETLVFKGARFLEGIIEHLLLNKEDTAKLCRREKVWQKRRAQWHL